MAVKEVFKVRTLKEAHHLLGTHQQEACLIAGGTDVLVKMREGDLKETVLIDISDLEDLSHIRFTETHCEIGGVVKFTQVVKNDKVKELFSGLWQACYSVGAPQIRNAGTLGGNLANGSPAADSAPPLLALGASVVISSENGVREVSLSDFYLDKGKTVIESHEILETIRIPLCKGPYQINFAKLGLRNALAISRLSVGIYYCLDEFLVIRDLRIASGSIGLSPLREREMEAFLLGKPLNKATVQMGAEAFSNVVLQRLSGRSTCGFKKEAVKGVFTQAMTQGREDYFG